MKIAILLAAIVFVGCGKEAESPPPAVTQRGVAKEDDQTKTLERLTQTVRKYAAETRGAPKSLSDLVAAGYLPEAPTPPAGKQYVIDDQLRVQLK